mmetsp:Transcript_88052/g.128723  ORF Transcript_88052/g.128723 Transcript_88052/m.128723 type:complete len:83 (+) Transcript_88052:365-613(+)
MEIDVRTHNESSRQIATFYRTNTIFPPEIETLQMEGDSRNLSHSQTEATSGDASLFQVYYDSLLFQMERHERGGTTADVATR